MKDILPQGEGNEEPRSQSASPTPDHYLVNVAVTFSRRMLVLVVISQCVKPSTPRIVT